MNNTTKNSRKRRRRSAQRKQGRSLQRRVLHPEKLETRLLLAGSPGDVVPTVANNLGFDRGNTELWGSEFVNSGTGTKVAVVPAGGQLHHEGVNLSASAPASGPFGYATVGKYAKAPDPSQVSSSTIWRTVTLYPGETLEAAVAMVVGLDSPNVQKKDSGFVSYGNYYTQAFTVGSTVNQGWTSGWQTFRYTNNTGQTLVDNLKATAVKPYRAGTKPTGQPKSEYRVTVAIDQVYVHDNDTSPPTIVTSTGNGADGDNNYFSWNVSDPSGISKVDVRVYNQTNGNIVREWLGAPAVGSIDMNDVGVGTFKMLVQAWDNDNNRPNDISYGFQWLENYTIADDDTGAPGISDANVRDQNDGEDNYVEWFVGDASGVARAIVDLQREVGNTGSNQWSSFFSSDDQNTTPSKGGRIDLNSQPPGRYRFRVQAWDADTDWNGDQRYADTGWKIFTISDDDTTVPTAALSGSSGTESWGLRNAFSWVASDASGIEATGVTITRNGQTVYSNSRDPSTGEVVLDGWGLGTYVIKVAPIDNDVDRPGDQLTLSPPAERTVTVTNSAPVANGDTATVGEDSLLVVTQPKLVDNDTDPDPGDTLTVAAVNGNQAAVGKTIKLASGASLTVNADGSYTYDPRGYFNALPAGTWMTDSFTYTVRDYWNLQSTATVIITITGVNDIPFPRDDSYSVAEDGQLTVSAPGVIANDFDADGEKLTVASVTQPKSGTVSVNADGSFVYTPNPNFQGTDSFTYRATDGKATSPDATVNIVVTSVNDAPVLAAIGNKTVDEENPLQFTVTAADPNDDPANTVTLSASGLPTGATFDAATGKFQWTPTESQQGTYDVTFTATDNGSPNLADSETITITVNEVNDIPVVTLGSDTTINEGDSLVSSGFFSDPDPAPDAWTATVDYGDGTGVQSLSLASDKTFRLEHRYADDGTFTVTVRVTDAAGTVGTDTLIVTVNNVAPTIALSGAASVLEGSPFVLTLGAVTDPGADHVTSYRVDWGDGRISTYTQGGDVTHIYADGPTTRRIVVDLTDEDGVHVAAGARSVAIVNVAPTISVSDQKVSHYSDLQLALPFSDPGFDDATASPATKEDFAVSIDWGDGTSELMVISETSGQPGVATTGIASATHRYASDGTYTALVTISDDDGGQETQTFVVTVGRSIFVLNSKKAGALSLRNKASIDIDGNVNVNSRSKKAISVSGKASLTADSINVVGGVRVRGRAKITGTLTTGVAPAADPLASLPVPAAGPNQGKIDCEDSSTLVLNPGVYREIEVSGKCNVTLNPGVYVIAGGEFEIKGKASLKGTGVTIYLAGANYPSPGGKFKEVRIKTKGTVQLSAPTSGPYAGVLLFQARDNRKRLSLSGDLSGLSGTIYAPAAQLALRGTTTLTTSIIADRLRLSGRAASRLSSQSDGSVATVPVETQGDLLDGEVTVAIQDPNGKMGVGHWNRFRAAIGELNNKFSPYNVILVELPSIDYAIADVRVRIASTSPCGGVDQGILGCASTEGDITLVDGWSWYAGAADNNVGSGQYDFQTIMTHELGHAIGLDHSGDATSAMFNWLAPSIARRVISKADLAVISRDASHEALRAAPGPDPRTVAGLVGQALAGLWHSETSSGNPASPSYEVIAGRSEVITERQGVTAARIDSASQNATADDRSAADILTGQRTDSGNNWELRPEMVDLVMSTNVPESDRESPHKESVPLDDLLEEGEWDVN